MIYFAKITKQSNRSYFVEFPELQGCLSEGKDLNEALAHAKEALEGWLVSHCDRDLNIPSPRATRGKDYYPIEIDVQISFAIMLRKIRKERGFSQTDVAKRLGVSQQAYAKLESPTKANPSLSTIQKLSEALDVDLVFDLAA